MIINWAGFTGVNFDPKRSTVADKIACAPPPTGDVAKWYQIGGQPMVINKYSKHVEEAKLLFKWWFQKEQQMEWARGGGGVCVKSIAEDPAFIEMAPYNRAYKDCLPYQRDFWNIPQYSEMLKVQQENLNAAVIGKMDVKAALDDLAQKQHNILAEAGMIKS
jgi:ABC-type glycerol-3-phosphate transport system substrate-binding protein